MWLYVVQDVWTFRSYTNFYPSDLRMLRIGEVVGETGQLINKWQKSKTCNFLEDNLLEMYMNVTTISLLKIYPRSIVENVFKNT